MNFCFYLFDEDGSGEIDAGELAQVLQAAHLASRMDPGIKAKAATVLQQADRDGNGTIGFEEFVALAARFPNLLLPDFNARDASGNLIVASTTATARARTKLVDELATQQKQNARETQGF